MQGLEALPLVEPGPMRVPHATTPLLNRPSAATDWTVFYGLIIYHGTYKVNDFVMKIHYQNARIYTMIYVQNDESRCANFRRLRGENLTATGGDEGFY